MRGQPDHTQYTHLILRTTALDFCRLPIIRLSWFTNIHFRLQITQNVVITFLPLYRSKAATNNTLTTTTLYPSSCKVC